MAINRSKIARQLLAEGGAPRRVRFANGGELERFKRAFNAAQDPQGLMDEATFNRLYGGRYEQLFNEYKASPNTFFYAGDDTQGMYDRFNAIYNAPATRPEDKDILNIVEAISDPGSPFDKVAKARSQQAARNEAALDVLNQSMAPTTSTPSVVDISSAAATRPENVDTTTLEEIMNQPLDPVPTNNPFENSLGAPVSRKIFDDPRMQAAADKGLDPRMGRTYEENIQAMADPRLTGRDSLTGMSESEMLPGIPGLRSLAEEDAIRKRVLEAQMNESGRTFADGKYANEAEAIADLGLERYNQLFSKGGEVSLDDAKEKAPPGEFLAYINPKEARMLKDAGGSGIMTAMGIPSFTEDERDQEAMNAPDYSSLDNEEQQAVDRGEPGAIMSTTSRDLQGYGPTTDINELSSPSFFGGIGNTIRNLQTQAKNRSIRNFVNRNMMSTRDAVLASLPFGPKSDVNLFDVYQQMNTQGGLFTEGLTGTNINMDRARETFDKLSELGIDITKDIGPQLDKVSTTDFRSTFGLDRPTPVSDGAPVLPRLPQIARVPSDIESQKSDMAEFIEGIRAINPTAFNIPERFRLAEGGEPRQEYGLGKLVKKLTGTVKKVVKSDLGKAALTAAAVYYAPALFSGTAGFGQGSTYRNFFGGLGGLDKIPGGGVTGTILDTSLLGGLLASKEPEQDINALSERISDKTGIDVAKIRGEVQQAYQNKDTSTLAKKYPFLVQEEYALPSFAAGGDVAAMGGIMDQEQGMMNLGGNEMDLRGGGFVPIGAKEKADDVPARLSKNEFVFTADAVRAAGGGSVDRGADLMYKTMKQLENKVV